MVMASVAPSARAEPVSLKTMKGRTNCVTEFPKFETVSPGPVLPEVAVQSAASPVAAFFGP
jgi:hypothetical protein